MSLPVYIGNELDAAGYRLMGARIIVPRDQNLPDLFEEARTDAPLIMVSASVAEALGEEVMAAAVIAAGPPVMVVADAVGEANPLDMEREVRAALGVL